jgi:hypothetical protein
MTTRPVGPDSNDNFSTWLTKDQAAAAIGVSTKTVEKLAQDGQLQQTVWRPQGRGAARAVYHPDDVTRIAQQRRPGLPAFVVPAGAAGPANGNGAGAMQTLSSVSAASPTGEDVLRLVFAAALRQLTSEKPPTSEKSEKLFLTLDEAVALSGLSPANLRRRCRSGWPGAIKDRGWKIRRKDLESL